MFKSLFPSSSRPKKEIAYTRGTGGHVPKVDDQTLNGVGEELPGYQIDMVLGRGSTSTVYRATQESLGRYVAIKRFSPQKELPENVKHRFEREAAMWAHLSHENLVHLYDYRAAQGSRYIVLEYCDGMELSELLRQCGPLPPKVAVAILYQCLAGLEYIHRFAIVHRDIKPGNIMITKQGVAKLMDFGISLCPELEPLTQPGQILGTPAYMSPEQALGKEVTTHSDLFAIGVIFFEMLEGKTPFRSTTLQSLLEEVQTGRYLKPNKKHAKTLRDIISSCLRKPINRRANSASELKLKLESFLRRQGVGSTRDLLRSFLIEQGIVSSESKLFPGRVDAIVKDRTDQRFGNMDTVSVTNPKMKRSRRIWVFGGVFFLCLFYYVIFVAKPDLPFLSNRLQALILKLITWIQSF